MRKTVSVVRRTPRTKKQTLAVAPPPTPPLCNDNPPPIPPNQDHCTQTTDAFDRVASNDVGAADYYARETHIIVATGQLEYPDSGINVDNNSDSL